MKSCFMLFLHMPDGCHRRHPPRHVPPHGGYRPIKVELNPSIGSACSGAPNIFATFCKIARGTCHACNRSERNRHHRLSAAPAHRTNIRPSRLDQPFGLWRRECSDPPPHTHRKTSSAQLFPSDPPEEIFEQSFQC